MQENDILGSPDLHGRLCLSSCILAELLRCAPASVSMEQLVREVGHPHDEVAQMCGRLSRCGLLQAGEDGEWRLAGDPARMTLADLFSALLAPAEGRSAS